MQQTVTTIQGERVLLRPFQEGDAEEAARVWTPELTHMYGGSPTAASRPTAESRRRGQQQIAASGEHHFAIEADDRYIGFVGLRVDDEEQSGSYRIGIANPDCWGRGYGTEVARLVLRYAFETLGLHRVRLKVAAYNVRARRCYEKSGLRMEGVLRESFQVEGEWQDDVLMAVLREEWEAQSSAASAGCADGLAIRTYWASDYDQVIALWSAVGLGPDDCDSTEALNYKLVNDRGPFLIAVAGDRVVGTAMASWDGRWAWVYRVAVAPDWRRRGIGARLMARIEERLAELGASRVRLVTGRDNEQAASFYAQLGYEVRDGLVTMRKVLAAEERGNGSQYC